MNSDQAHDAVTLSAMTVAGVYTYRKLVESKPSSPTSHFVIGFGFVYVTLAVLADEAPALGGMLALLIAVSDLLVNGVAIIGDLSDALKATAAVTKPTTTTPAAPAAPAAATVPFGSTPPTAIPLLPATQPSLPSTPAQP